MTPLGRALADRIRKSGPMPLEAYMEACNNYYYATRDPLGSSGDFTTAPEIHQMFGEIIGAALADAWTRAGKPPDAVYAELGPGRGTLAADALRLLRRAGFDGEVHLVETSPILRQAQAAQVPEARFHDDVETLPAAPLLLVANEFFDALPIRQLVDGHQRRLVLAGGGLAFDRDGPIVEISPARSAVAASIARHLAARGGAERTRAYLRGFVARLGLDGTRPVHDSGHLTRCRADDAPLRRERVLVAGDAAGLLEPWSREGISYALRSGALAGAAVAAGDLAGYERAVAAELTPSMQAGFRLLETFSRHPGFFHALLATPPGWRFFTRFCQGGAAFERTLARPPVRAALALLR